MLKITELGAVTRIDSARSFAGRGYYWTTAYLVGDVLVDTGCRHTAGDLAVFLEGKALSLIANTHSHEDHIGADGLLQRNREGLTIRAHPAALHVLEQPRQAQPLQFYRRLFWGWPEAAQAQAVQDGEWIEAGQCRFQVMYTPGHSPDHVCLYEPQEGWLFSGDLFVGGKDRALRAGSDVWGIIASLKRVASLRLTCLFPGCARVRVNPYQELHAKIVYLEETGERVKHLHQQGMSVEAIANALFGGRMWIETITWGHFTRANLVRSYLGVNDEDGPNP
jgi:glyoxylase-like metal-dependent hydrolase (beta-lactamase superfamily II)